MLAKVLLYRGYKLVAFVWDDFLRGAKKFPHMVQQQFCYSLLEDLQDCQVKVGHLRKLVDNDQDCIHGAVFGEAGEEVHGYGFLNLTWGWQWVNRPRVNNCKGFVWWQNGQFLTYRSILVLLHCQTYPLLVSFNVLIASGCPQVGQ